VTTITAAPQNQVHLFRWHPTRDLAALVLSWLLVVGALCTATFIVGQETWGGMAYFVLYAVVGAALFGVGIPLYWMAVVRKRPIAELGITTRWLGVSVVLQLVFAAFQYIGTLAKAGLPSVEGLLPLFALALAVGFFEAVFWRGWILLRLEEAFGIIPAVLLGSTLYATYHIGYGMPLSEMTFLFFIGIMFAVVFRLTKNVFILWPVFQPMGQLITLIKDKLALPLLASLGFIEVLILMFVLVWLASRYQRKHS
jgi:membrane protease YdiL (CAAX protease family)